MMYYLLYSHNRITLKIKNEDFPGDPVVKNLPANEGDGLVPGPRKFHIPQDNYACAPQLLRPHCLKPMVHNKRSQHTEELMHRNWRVAPASPN